MPWDYFVHLDNNGPPSFAFLTLGYFACLLFNFLFASDILRNVIILFRVKIV